MNELFKIADLAVKGMTDAGADKAACTVSKSEKREFNVDGGKFSLFRTLFSNGLMMTALKDGKRGNVNVNRIDAESLNAAVKQVIAVCDSGEEDPAWGMAESEESVVSTDGCPDGDMDKFFERIRELTAQIGERYPKIIIEQLIASHAKVTRVYKNSFGVMHETTSGEYSVSVMYSGHEGEKAGSFFGSGITTDSLDTPFIELGALATELSDAEKQIHTQPLEGKFEGTAVFTPSCLASLWSVVIGNFTGSQSLHDGSSFWKDKLNEKVADERITLSLKPSDKRIVCGQRVAGDGFAAKDFDIIKNGVLKSFTLNLYAANKTGNERALNSSSSFVMEAGDKSLDEIVAGIERGIIVGRFSGGMPGANGDFSGVAKNSFLIENGKVTQPLSETMINGNLADMLNNLVAISSDYVLDGSTVLPYAAFGGITVSGK